MDPPNQQPIDGNKPLRVRWGRIESVDLYEIKDTELDHLEQGASGDLQFNFAIFLFSTAFSSICALATATFPNKTVESIFLFISITGIILATYLTISWWQSRKPIKALCQKIRDRIPPEKSAPPEADT